ncbi:MULTISPECIES: cysteine desulfurase family protein [Listeria]|uniref:cysteine desulfurase family protein n=1 Tax=Listeria TaxID=1637 RepID=UPI000B5958CE|nr:MULTISPECIES: cysteine desulfurase family protein [Listeria]
MENKIYLDHAATSPVHPEVVQAMLGVLTNDYGNPSSVHYAGRSARKTLDESRAKIANQIGASEREIIFTSGGTESDNTAVIGTALASKERGKHIITSQIEHHAVLKSCVYLESLGFSVTYLPVGEDGLVRVADVQAALREDTILVTIMYGNNEMGAIQPIEEIAELLKEHQAVFHTDAVQAFGLVPIDVSALGVDLLSASAHKINGPRGVGFLYVKQGTVVEFPFHGGEQERARRSGTENLAGIAGFAKASELMAANRTEKVAEYEEFKSTMVEIFSQNELAFEVNGSAGTSLPHILSVRFHGVQVEQLLMNLDMAGVAVSSGSACTAGTVDPSHVLVAIFGENHPGVTETVRISFGLGNTYEEVVLAASKITDVVNRLAKRKEQKA